jgi:outer membrane protein assembly factor BamB
MVKKLAIAALLLVIVTGSLLWLFGIRVSLAGSGLWLAFSRPDYDTLEADRARQQKLPLPPAASGASAEPAGSRPLPAIPAATDTPRPPAANAEPPDVTAPRRPQAGEDWTDFRGPHRDGRYEGVPVRSEWPAGGLPRLWKQPIGLGYASFVVADGRAFTIEQRRHQEVVAAYAVDTGRELWTNSWDAEFTEPLGGDGPRATPTYHEGHVYALGAAGELRRLDARTGAVQWRHNILEENGAANLEWGMAAAPLIVDEKVIVLPGGPNGRSIAAYHKDTGRLVWSALDDQQAYTSPMLVTLAGVRQILAVGAKRIVGVTVDEGRLLWEYPWSTFQGINVAQPLLVGSDRFFISASYGHGAALIEIAHSGEGLAARPVWENTRMKNKFTSSVLRDGYIYGLDEAILACLDAATGDQKWKGGRYGYGQVLLVDDRLIVLTEDGDVVLVRASSDSFQELARFTAIEGKTWNHPMIAGGRLFVRNGREMAAFDIKPLGDSRR